MNHEQDLTAYKIGRKYTIIQVMTTVALTALAVAVVLSFIIG